MQPWIILIIFLAVLAAIYIISGLIIKMRVKKAKRKAIDALDALASTERDRLERLEKIKNILNEDRKFIPKNREESFEDTRKLLDEVPADVAKAKGQNDIIVLYLRKFRKEKRLLAQKKYKDIDEQLSKEINIDPNDKTSPYYSYNRKALRYNALRGRTFFSLFINNGNNPQAPVL